MRSTFGKQHKLVKQHNANEMEIAINTMQERSNNNEFILAPIITTQHSDEPEKIFIQDKVS